MPKKMYESHVYTISFYFNKKERELEEKFVNNSAYYNLKFRMAIKEILTKY